VTKFNTLQVHSYFTKNYNTMINSGVTVPLVSPVDTESTKIEQKPASVIQEKRSACSVANCIKALLLVYIIREPY
jgi:hypothetical protein